MSKKRKFESRKWCDLAPEALKMIKTKLDHHHSTINLRLVCKKWGNMVEPPFCRVHDFLPISFSFNESISTITAMRLVPAVVVLLRSRHPYSSWWLVTVEQSTRDKLRLFHPLTRSITPWETQVCHPNLDYVILSDGYSFRHMDGVTPVFSHVPESFCVSKMILWRKPPGPEGLMELLLEGDIQEPEYSIVRLYNQGNLQCIRISDRSCDGVYCAVCVEDRCTFEFPKPTDDGFDDFVLWEDLVWAVNYQGQLFWINYHTLEVKVSGCTGISTPSECGSKRLLVRAKEGGSQDLYLAVCNSKCGEFWVYKYSNLGWEKMETLGDLILFVGYDTCFFASTQILNNIPGNCVIFPVNLYPCYDSDKRPRKDAKCHGVEDYLELRVTSYGKGSSHMCISEWPGQVPNLFWPPPSAILKPKSGEESNGGSTSNDPNNANAGTEVIVQ